MAALLALLNMLKINSIKKFILIKNKKFCMPVVVVAFYCVWEKVGAYFAVRENWSVDKHSEELCN